MVDIFCYSYVEDRPSAEVAKKLVEVRNNSHEHKVYFKEGFPLVTKGNVALKKKCENFVNMAKAGVHTFCITDLDRHNCAGELIRRWFGISGENPANLPEQIIFRVAVREIESWILADRKAWAKYIGIAQNNFEVFPDTLPDPKQHLLNVLRKKGNKKKHKDMIPHGTAHIGSRYNEVLCHFIKEKWEPKRAAQNSPSLSRAIRSLDRL